MNALIVAEKAFGSMVTNKSRGEMLRGCPRPSTWAVSYPISFAVKAELRRDALTGFAKPNLGRHVAVTWRSSFS